MAGIVGNNDMDKVKLMLAKLSHRGSYNEKLLSESNNIIAGTWLKIEDELQQMSFQSSCVWDGFVPEPPTPSRLPYWKNPFAIAAFYEDQLLLARDPLGAKPLYYGVINDNLVFASEVKALLPITRKIFEFPPGNWYTPKDGFVSFFQPKNEILFLDEENNIIRELRKRLENAVQQCCIAEEMGVWLSGGVDSTVVTALAVKWVNKLKSFVCGLEGASDILYATKVAEHFGIDHHIIKVTLSDLLKVLPQVIYYLESFDALLVRSSLTNYIASNVAANYVGGILSGEGGDELFAGYDYIKTLTLDDVPAELEDILLRLHNTALQRVDRSSQANGLTAFTPFTNMDVVEYALKIPVKYKLMRRGNEIIEKWILRKVIDGLVPDNTLWRPKAKFWQGAGVGELLAEYAEDKITDSDYKRERVLPNGWGIKTKEELMYYRIFKEHFGEMEYLDWMGRTKGAAVQ